MAWQMRITEISGEVQEEIEDADGNPTGTFRTVDLTLEGRFRAVVEYFDEADPATLLFPPRSFDFGFGITGAEALERFREVGRRVRDTRQLVASQQTNVGQTLSV